MRGLPELAPLTLLALAVAASCSRTRDNPVSDSIGGEAGEMAAGRGDPGSGGGGSGNAEGGSSQGGSGGSLQGASGEGSQGGSGESSSGGSGGDASSRGGMAATGNLGGMQALGGDAGMGGSGEENPPAFPGHAATICDPEASYQSPFQSLASRTATRLSESYFFTEGPVWVAAGGYLLFTDMYDTGMSPYVPGAHIERFTPPSTFDTFILDSDNNGLALSADGLTLFAARRIKANTDDGEIASYLLSSKAKATVLESPVNPNDLTVRSDENLYFSDGDVYRIDPDDNVSTAVHIDSVSANGVTLSPDENTLYSGWSDGVVYASALGSVGQPGAPAPFTTLQDGGHPDGMTVDCAGNLYVADYANGTVQVFDSGGTYLDKITLPAASGPSPPAEHATNVAFGGTDHRTLFITGHRGDWSDPAVGELHSITLNVPGLPY